MMKYRFETLNTENERIDLYNCKSKREIRKLINILPNRFYRTTNLKNDKLVKGLSKLNKIEPFEF